MDETILENILIEQPRLIMASAKACLDLIEKSEEQQTELKKLVFEENRKVQANPAFKNEGQRKTELDALLIANCVYQDSLKFSEELDKQVALERINLEYLQNTFKAYLAIARIQEN